MYHLRNQMANNIVDTIKHKINSLNLSFDIAIIMTKKETIAGPITWKIALKKLNALGYKGEN